MKAVMKKIAKQDFDFLYHHTEGGLYFNKIAQTRDLAMVASLPSSKERLN